MPFAIKIKNLSKNYGTLKALDDLSFEVKRGHIHGLLGPNGAGKTSLIKIISGLLVPDSGEMQVEKEIGLLGENPPLYPHMKVASYLKFTGELLGLSASELQKSCDELTDKCRLEKFSGRLIGNLSRGQKQRIGIAQAMMGNPKLLILDEPLAGLDPESLLEMRSLIKSLVETNPERTVLISGHQLYEIEQLCSDLSILSQGRLMISADIETVKAQALDSFEVIFAELEGYNEKIEESLKELFHLEKIISRYKKQSKTYEVKLFSHKGSDLRKDLIKFFIESGLSILKFEKQGIDLESAYSKLTAKSKEEKKGKEYSCNL